MGLISDHWICCSDECRWATKGFVNVIIVVDGRPFVGSEEVIEEGKNGWHVGGLVFINDIVGFNFFMLLGGTRLYDISRRALPIALGHQFGESRTIRGE